MVEVTREVTVDREVEVEVTREVVVNVGEGEVLEVEVEVTREVPVEVPVTRQVEVTRVVEVPAEGMMEQGESRVQTIRDRGSVVCASNNSLAGFGFINENGDTVGFDIDLCRALAAAVLGDPNAANQTHLSLIHI